MIFHSLINKLGESLSSEECNAFLQMRKWVSELVGDGKQMIQAYIEVKVNVLRL